MDDRIASVLEDAFPGREVTDLLPTGPSWNQKNRTVDIEFADGERIYLKVATDRDSSRIARERAVLAYMGANTDVPVPDVVASDPEWSIPYLVTAPVAGPNLIELWADASTSERAGLAYQVGSALAGIHTCRFERHSQVLGGGTEGLELDTGSWTAVLGDTIAETRALAPSDRFEEHFDRVIEAIEANRDLLDEAPAVLCHGDPAAPNCFHANERIGFLDWEIAHVGDPARELHRAQDQLIDPPRAEGPEEVVAGLHEGYRERAGGLPAGFEEREAIYEAVRFLGVSGFFERWVATREESLEALAGWVEAEMDRCLAEIR